ncbi:MULTISPECIES: resuscitation-promoting factor protein RpfC [Streptomyces]|uniref:Resuscitation-promoting factor protein RpfC n=2 Tax=Streptomyces violaceoruber group TaxID=2867121 RepID=A0ABT4NVA9_9ACTN|nr:MULTISPECIES: resuscitation-promoting factor protein RpfC [Streptomyces]MCW8118552.1 resuscitation-promoting factor protein RpfC [Streptomyces anthocyanicus]MCZ4633059.1 resuscitation-promoting factor protein RpfC [Streptomyces rubrogriseus]MDX3321616.1 resuscitation-promoting factor protein RpfC [Streptomyces sp. ME03-5684b]WTC09306.1 resuscitation-promoting factor protein RpfC [Streptomyces anthocyanicus]WTC50552.1 resuscitation-promoting factor protein RpfC [Streptomyces anthocyanicus]
MLSGNGRHRRPRQAPALVVAAGVTGSAIAIPLLGATGAHAADSANWDQVAECETGGAWSQNSGNGYYGGLQLSQDAWEQYGGLDYAPSADQASRSQQIRIAEKIHASQGIAAWPTCGLLAGLGNGSGGTGDGSGAAGDGASEGSDASGEQDTTKSSESPATTETPESSQSSESSGSSETPESTSGASSSSPSPSSSPSSSSSDAPSDGSSGVSGDSSDGAGQSAKPDTSTESDPSGSAEPQGTEGSSGSGKHRGGSADEGATGEGRTDPASGRHASRDGGEREAGDGRYVVRTGDSLWAIADSLDVDGGWHALYADNETVVGADPDHILPGQTLTVTGESGEK